jgi:hypothetical protein
MGAPALSSNWTSATPPQIAALINVESAKIVFWINTGALRAINIAEAADGQRSRWRVLRQDWETFLAGRANDAPALEPGRRGRKTLPKAVSRAGKRGPKHQSVAGAK